MKTLFRILVILLVGVGVAGAAYLILNDGSTASMDTGSRPTFDGASADFEAGDMPTRPDDGDMHERPDGGDMDAGSSFLGRGFSDITENLIKISVITVAVVSLQFVFNLLRKRKSASPAIG